jgi:hypothetical protein
MCRLTQLFSIEELEELDEKHLTILREAILCEIRVNPQIQRILKEKFQPMRERMASQARPRGATRSARSRRTPPATDPTASEEK